MTKKANQKEYKVGQITGFIKFFAQRYNEDENYLRACLISAFPSLKQKELCPNCQANMKIDLYSPDILDGLLLFAMAQAVRKNQESGMGFTEANMIHVPTLSTTDAIRHRTTRCSYLNFIKQPDKAKNSGNWVITSWGWKALRGEPVPKYVKYFRGKFMERGTETITLSQMFQTHVDKVKEAVARRKLVKSDYVDLIKGYSPTEWVEIGGIYQSQMFQ